MGRYYRVDNFRGFPHTETGERSGGSRQGVIPRPETPSEKIRRLSDSGYVAPPLESTKAQESEYAGYNLGNKELPAYSHKQEIIEAVNANRITLLTGPTGSGKTTQFAQFALEAGYERIVYLQPRRNNVDNISERLHEELTSQLGEEGAKGLVGMAHSERVTIDKNTPIQVMTSGTFTKKVPELAEEWADMRVVVVADEIHENNLETEFAAAFAARQVERNANWRLVFASATPDQNVLGGSYKAINGGDVPVVTIEGRPHHLEMIEEPDIDIIAAYHAHSAGIAKSMIFVEGKRTINETIDQLRRSMDRDEVARTKFYKLHAKISERAKQEIFSMELAPGEKAIIVSTSAGQSGITVPGLGLVITSGLTKSPELDGENAPGLPTRHCTQAEIVQQGGRAGRDIEGGKCVLARPTGFGRAKNSDNDLYDFIPLQRRYPDMPPEIYSSNISRNVLAASAMGEDFLEFNNYLKNSVKPSSIHEAYDVLHKLGAVDDGNKVTDTGRLMDVYPLRPELSRAVAEVSLGRSLNIQVYTLIIAAAVEAKY
ncbi:hypothetical protein B7Z17_01440 [Candidatus Saccharibacteria bacterium 32-49-10]|nr:MAG: hypothetical protein B7Z17_01440 [Candidatus Saccharibacteria bacterium 32-49-10]